MKIIKEGKMPEERIYKHVCITCGTVFEFAKKEAQYILDQRDGDSLQISCPICNNYCYVSVTRFEK
jgi:hypothetical protein